MLAILGLLLALLAGALILAAAIQVGRNETIDLNFVVNHLVSGLIGLALIFGGVVIYGGRYSSGGFVNLVIGIVAIILQQSVVAGILGIVSGIFGLLAHEART